MDVPDIFLCFKLKGEDHMGFFILIGLCLTVLGGGCLAVKPLNQKHEIKPFRTFDDFFI